MGFRAIFRFFFVPDLDCAHSTGWLHARCPQVSRKPLTPTTPLISASAPLPPRVQLKKKQALQHYGAAKTTECGEDRTKKKLQEGLPHTTNSLPPQRRVQISKPIPLKKAINQQPVLHHHQHHNQPTTKIYASGVQFTYILHYNGRTIPSPG